MNINDAKNYIKNDVSLYLMKNEWGEYRIPVVRQRPIFLLGAPGIGKTAIMEQVASELGIALVSYSMTHHTRQSALGLPFIRHESYEGMEYDVSEYTMSEIIASIYSVMRDSGVKEGILFLDEINCVSETLAPSMLQFLQYKVFGKHRIPDGWVIVTAGNPPEYNKSVREFDVVTMDRLKVLEVEADYDTWKKYAREHGVRSEVTSFLEIHKDYFYHMEMTVKGRSYVTARGWEDLSTILALYNERNLPVDETLVGQYIRNDKIVKEFTAYYDLYNKYKRDYRLEDILSGNPPESAFKRSQNAGFDERLSVLGMLMDRLESEIGDVIEKTDFLADLLKLLKQLKANDQKFETASEVIGFLEKCNDAQRIKMDKLAKANSLSDKDKKKYRRMIEHLNRTVKEIVMVGSEAKTYDEAFKIVRMIYEDAVADMKEDVKTTKERMHNLFAYVEKAFAEGNEMLLLVTELTVNENSSRFIAQFGSEDYTKASETLMLAERQDAIKKEILELDI
ncbi:ATPase family associated with various cellular activities (AAA) [Eubacterium ruminantium]|nr:ATPase family associated with various cellular activities (AAA) [Eubacterium ruminantium]